MSTAFPSGWLPGESNWLKPPPHFPLSGLHPKSDVDILYIPRKGGGRGSITIEDCVELAIRCLEVYVHGSQGRMI